ncbi:uncharacterized protein LOC132755196 [Ruditapes philippinarum]|uniref:uncharacterized protein LOC132755196 n=1 Tax=Ruditapes philippinarum TaxID=129788 RepID=UPI00295C39B5|nr:uncharacterized protein LOC132755196 [Ruditapes philippinarum]
MEYLLQICVILVTVSPSMQQCSSFPSALDGTWTSTSFETITIDSTSMSLSMTKTFQSSHTASHFDCVLNSGTQYVFKMNQTVQILGNTLDVYPYGCFDFRQASTYSYYFYLNSATEITLSDLRFRAILTTNVDTITSLTDICNSSTVDTAEFYTMIKTGNETAAISAIQCPDPILGFFQYTYTDQTGTYCDNVNTSTIIACSNQSHAELLIDNTGCTTKEPFYSAGGEVGCIATIYVSSTSTYYTSYYNKDASLSLTSSRFTCVAMQQNSNGTVYLSLIKTDCVAGQSATQLPVKGTEIGAAMVLEPTYTCKERINHI